MGTVEIAGAEEDSVYAKAAALLTDYDLHAKMANAVNPYGDGNACRRIADAILWYFKRGEKPEDYLA